ncbi:hypothetical protein BLSMQ_2416 [Brevibacterium aurantiacum]|uniref:Uncharacterized protein n=1 Tax=Brevibacterium aurantiacum TaxID=273384 RepID=A0A1D7W573_BREAU|nr:hypothetical protein BLSMQ_2416 [Brevibacterium aurantiacum]
MGNFGFGSAMTGSSTTYTTGNFSYWCYTLGIDVKCIAEKDSGAPRREGIPQHTP